MSRDSYKFEGPLLETICGALTDIGFSASFDGDNDSGEVLVTFENGIVIKVTAEVVDD